MAISAYQAKYFAYELTKRSASDSLEKFGATLFDAKVDLNPHQVEAALFAFKSPLSKGAIIADEVGLGKTIEAGILLSQKWAEGKKRILIISPSSLRKQWSQELADKFYLPSFVLESRNFNESRKKGKSNPFDNTNKITICSYHFARNKAEFIQLTSWDLVVIDEAHYLRNVYKPSNKIANTLKTALADKNKVLLTATPLQNSINELYGLVSFIDENIFGDIKSFKAQFTRADELEYEDLRDRISPIVNRTLRKHVQEYVPYTNRISITEKFTPTDEEHDLYEQVTEYLQREQIYALPNSQRHLITLILRKLLASSTFALSGTLNRLIDRLQDILVENEKESESSLPYVLGKDYELYDEVAEDYNAYKEEISDSNISESDGKLTNEQICGIERELEDLKKYYELANSIEQNAKGNKLLVALDKGFAKLKELGAKDKAVIFTESRRTQEYVLSLLEKNGFKGKVVLFNGTNNDEKSKLIYKSWLERNKNSDAISGSKNVDIRAALVDYFKSDDSQILLATEAAAEGINLQFASMIVNYDLPWNPQRIEQRIGRCHRYGQKYDVVVINFLNTKNEADQRVFQLLNEKFKLFDGVFGASDEVLGAIGSGVDFEKRIADIYQTCRTKEEIVHSFKTLQQELESQIENKLKTTQQKLMENFDVDVIDKLKVRLDEAKVYVSKYEHWLWKLTTLGLSEFADFNNGDYSFKLKKNPDRGNMQIPIGDYTLSKNNEDVHRYRIGHPLAQFLIEKYKSIELDSYEITFDYSSNLKIVSAIENLKGKGGIIHIENFEVKSFDITDNLLLVGYTNDGIELDADICKRILELDVVNEVYTSFSEIDKQNISKMRDQHKDLLIESLKLKDTEYFKLEVDKLHKWAEDKILASEKELRDVKKRIKDLNRDSKKETSSEELLRIQVDLRKLEKKKRKLRQEIFDVEDEIEERRDNMIDEIKAKMLKAINEQPVFSIKWRLI